MKNYHDQNSQTILANLSYKCAAHVLLQLPNAATTLQQLPRAMSSVRELRLTWPTPSQSLLVFHSLVDGWRVMGKRDIIYIKLNKYNAPPENGSDISRRII